MDVISRQLASEQSVTSLRLEGLRPSAEATALLEAWVRGDISDDALLDAADRIAAGQPARGLLEAARKYP